MQKPLSISVPVGLLLSLQEDRLKEMITGKGGKIALTIIRDGSFSVGKF